MIYSISGFYVDNLGASHVLFVSRAAFPEWAKKGDKKAADGKEEERAFSSLMSYTTAVAENIFMTPENG